MPEPLLQVRDLTIHFGPTSAPVVDRANFDMGPGETVGLLGESGCGKTTLGLALIRLLPQTSRISGGSIRFRGREMLLEQECQLEKTRGAEISIIFQEPEMSLNPVIRVGDQIAEVLRAHTNWNRRRRREEAEFLLRQVRLFDAHIFSAYPHQLSGGECQRVVIAQALACRPAFLIADEPTSALDNTTEAEVLALLKELKERFSLSLFFITHNPLLLAGIAHRVLIMYAGRIVEEGSLAQVWCEPRHPYTKMLLRSIPPRPGTYDGARKSRLPVIPGGPPDFAHVVNGCPFAPRCPERIDICSMRDPKEVQLDNGARVRCLRYGR